ncbi:MAG: class I SAM-dependent methyltransferase, partial [Pyrinomonadaceae bacterium]|nr:class I SAM-dependent methyltransferase [Phycisphaerales bacterium]
MRQDRPSGTSIVVALGILTLSRRRQGHALVAKETGPIVYKTLRRMGRLPRLLSMNVPPVLAALIERLIVPGIITHFGIRKRLIRDAVDVAIRDGFSQIVVIGAGLDTLTLDLARANTDIRLVEIDHPATQGARRRMLEAAQVDPERMALLPADLTTAGLGEILARSPEF